MTPFHHNSYIRDVDQVKNPHVFVMGLAAGAGVLIFYSLAKVWPTNHFDLELLLGSFFTANLDPESRKLGVVIFLLVSGVSAFAYSFIFWSARRSGVWIGAQLAFFHYLVSGFFIGILPFIHPLIPGIIASPGLFMADAGVSSSITFFLAYLVYGILLGQFFDWASLRDEFKKPIATRGGYIEELYQARRHL